MPSEFPEVVYILYRGRWFIGVYKTLELAQATYPGKWEEVFNGGFRAPVE